MKQFYIEDEFWALFPKARIGAVVCHGIDNTCRNTDQYAAMLRQAEKEAHKYFKHTIPFR